MLRIVCGSRIEYTAGDTFRISVTAKGGFNENSQLRFIAAKDENSENLIDNTYDLTGEGEFCIHLQDKDIQKLKAGSDYVYKLTLLTADGVIVTQKSGDLTVKWGC